ncbi:MAG: vWA domain-containing protein, partial [Ferruginibacter sp.]
MKSIAPPIFAFVLTCSWFITVSSKKHDTHLPQTTRTATAKHTIQVAILLDVSNSMDGLIEQAKAQLWNMVSVMGKATCDNIAPQIEIALYEYGRPTNNARQGYVKQLSDFTTNLDKLSTTLFTIKTNGGDEYCGHVMLSSLNELNWDPSPLNYKVIFIAGNEDFLQGDVTYTKACAEARKKGVIINTIYCGNKMQGISEHWNLAGECGSGSFSNINQDAAIEDIPTPYDSVLFSLNDQLNSTYIAYGSAGAKSQLMQGEVDKLNYSMSKSVAAKRISVKGKKQLYNNSAWDLIDAAATDSMFVEKVDIKTLPENLQKKSRSELRQIVREKNVRRITLQKQISNLS